MKRLLTLSIIVLCAVAGWPAPASFAGSSLVGSPMTLVPVSVFGDAPNVIVSDVAIADIRGDEEPELLVAQAQPSSELLVFERQSTGSYDVVDSHALPACMCAIAHGDLDLDGDTDVAVTSTSGIRFFLQGASGLGSGQALDADEGAPSFIRIADLHPGGWAELVIGGNRPDPFVRKGVDVLERTGTGWTTTAVADTQAEDVEIADLDEDGRLDFAIAANSAVHTYLQDDDGTFVRSTLAGFTSQFVGIAVGDLNDDGHEDIVADEASTYSIFFGLGDGRFRAPESTPIDGSNGLTIADLNGDGLHDLVGRSGVWFELFLQGVGGTLDAPCPWRDVMYPAGGDADETGDLTGDGRPDVAAVTGSSNPVTVWENSTGAPSTITSSEVPATSGFGQPIGIYGTLEPWSVCPGTDVIGETIHLRANDVEVAQASTKQGGQFHFNYVPATLGPLELELRWEGDGLHTPSTTLVGPVDVIAGTKYLKVHAPEYVPLGRKVKVTATLLPFQIAADPNVTITATIPGGGSKIIASGPVDPLTGTLTTSMPNLTRTHNFKASWSGGDGFDPISVRTTTQVGSRTRGVLRGHHGRMGNYFLFRRGDPAFYFIDVAPNHTGDGVWVELYRHEFDWHRIAHAHFRLRAGSRVGVVIPPALLHADERYRIHAEFRGDQQNGGSITSWSYLRVG